MIPRPAAFQHILADAVIATGIHHPIPMRLQQACAGICYQQGDVPDAARTAEEAPVRPTPTELTNIRIEAVGRAGDGDRQASRSRCSVSKRQTITTRPER